MVQNCYHQHHHGVTPPLIRLQLVRIKLSSLQREFSVRRWRRNVETANPRELKTLHVGKTRTTHGRKSHHGLRKWNSSLHHASSLKSFRTAFTNEYRNCKTEEGNDTANAHILAAHEKAFACYDSCRESERYRTSVFLVFSLHTRTYTKCI